MGFTRKAIAAGAAALMLAGAVKVTGSASASPADASRALAPRIDWSANSAADGRGAYLGKGTHVLKARAVDAFVSVNIFFTISTNIFSPIAPPLFRRPRQRGCAASG